jgi:hypothetical protein
MTNPPDEHHERKSEAILAALPIRHDLPCIKCKYNLRGLRDGDRCPECGEAVGHTLDEIESNVLCTGCMAPNLASDVKCRVCGNALNNAGATSDYFRGGSGPGTTASRRRFTSVVLIYFFLAPTALSCSSYVVYSLIAMFNADSNFEMLQFFLFMISTIGAIVLWAILFAVTRAYIKRPPETEGEDGASSEDATEPDEDA